MTPVSEPAENKSPLKRFREMLAALLSVSKKEVDEALQAEKRIAEPPEMEPTED